MADMGHPVARGLRTSGREIAVTHICQRMADMGHPVARGLRTPGREIAVSHICQRMADMGHPVAGGTPHIWTGDRGIPHLPNDGRYGVPGCAGDFAHLDEGLWYPTSAKRWQIWGTRLRGGLRISGRGIVVSHICQMMADMGHPVARRTLHIWTRDRGNPHLPKDGRYYGAPGCAGTRLRVVWTFVCR
jgi:hypothetical protein